MKRSRRDEIKQNIGGKGKRGPKAGRGKQPGNTPLTEPLTTPQARDMAKNRARAEYGPTVNAIKGDLRGSKAREKQITNWFGGLGDQINQAAQATDASYGQANAALLAHMNAATAAAQASQGQIASNNQAMIGLTGADASLTAPIEAQVAAGANQRNLTQTALAAPIAQGGANQAAYLRNTGINARREGIQQHQNESKRRQKIKEDLTAARKERAQKAQGNFYDIRQDERDYGIQRAAFKLDKTTAAQEAQQAAADRALAEAKFQHDVGDDSVKNKIAAKNAADDAVGPNGLTPGEKRDAKQGRRNAMVTARNLYSAAKKPPQSDAEWAAFAQLVAQESEISPTEAQWAVKRLRRQVGSRAQSGPSQQDEYDKAVKETPDFNAG